MRGYRIVQRLGSGAFGTTSLVEKDGERFALKELDVGELRDWKALELFEREGKVLSELDHPGIPKTIDVFHDEAGGKERFFLVQTLAPGKSLAERVKDGYRASEKEAERIAREVLGILAYLHGREPPIIHRDVKPENLVMDDDGRLRLVDFGCVQSGLSESIALTGTVAGTFGYMAPEQLRGRASAASDLFALGSTLVFVISGHSPADFPHPKNQIDLRELKVSPHFRAWLSKMTAPAIEDRFTSATQAAGALSERTPANHSTSSMFVMAGVVIAVAVLAAAGQTWVRSARPPTPSASVPPVVDLPPPPPVARPSPRPIAIWDFEKPCLDPQDPFESLKTGSWKLNQEKLAGAVHCEERGARFNGGYFESPDTPAFHLKNALTITAIVKPLRLPGNHTVLSKWYAPDMYMLLLTDGYWRFTVATPGGQHGMTHDVETVAKNDAWVHLAGVYDGKKIRLYIDGKKMAERPAPGPLQDSNRPIVIGSHPSWNAFDGVIRNVSLYDVALTDEEIASTL